MQSTTNCPPVFHITTSLTQISPASGPLTPLRWTSSQWLSHSVLSEPCPTRQSSFSSTYLLRDQPPNPRLHSDSNLVHIVPDKTAPVRSHGTAPSPNPAFWKLVSLKAQYQDRFCFHYTLDHEALQSHHMDSLTTVLLTTPTVPLFPTVLLQQPCCDAHLWMSESSLLGELLITSNSTWVNLNSSSSCD